MIKENLVIWPIIRYVTSLVSQAGETPQLLPGELVLCEKFGVARGTVRRAMKYLIERSIVILLPKRRGYFSNPKYSRTGEINIGVLVANGYFAAMSYLASDMYSGILQGLNPLYCSFQFLSISSSEPQTIAELTERNALKALLWLCPEEENLPAIRHLTEKSFPVVAIENPHIPNRTHPERNTLIYDRENAGVIRAQQVLRANFRKPLYCCEPGETKDAFAQYIRKNGGIFTSESAVSLDDLPGKLDPRKKLSAFDCIVCDGDRKRYSALMQLLARHPQGGKIRVFVEKEVNSEDIVPDFPNLDITFLNPPDMRKSAFQAGKRAGTILRGILTGKKPAVFKSETFQ